MTKYGMITQTGVRMVLGVSARSPFWDCSVVVNVIVLQARVCKTQGQKLMLESFLAGYWFGSLSINIACNRIIISTTATDEKKITVIGQHQLEGNLNVHFEI